MKYSAREVALERRRTCNEWVIGAFAFFLPPIFPAAIYGWRQRTWGYFLWTLYVAIPVCALSVIARDVYPPLADWRVPIFPAVIFKVRDLDNYWVLGFIHFWPCALKAHFLKAEAKNR